MLYIIRGIIAIIIFMIYAYMDIKERKIGMIWFYVSAGLGVSLYILDWEDVNFLAITSHSLFLILTLIILLRYKKMATGDVYSILTLGAILPIVEINDLSIISNLATPWNLEKINVIHLPIPILISIIGLGFVSMYHHGMVLFKNLKNVIKGNKFLEGFEISEIHRLYAIFTIYKNINNDKMVIPIDVKIKDKWNLNYDIINQITSNDDAELRCVAKNRYVWPLLPVTPFMLGVLCFIVIDLCT